MALVKIKRLRLYVKRYIHPLLSLYSVPLTFTEMSINSVVNNITFFSFYSC